LSHVGTLDLLLLRRRKIHGCWGEWVYLLCCWSLPKLGLSIKLQVMSCWVLLPHIGAFDLLLLRRGQVHGSWSEWVHLLCCRLLPGLGQSELVQLVPGRAVSSEHWPNWVHFLPSSKMFASLSPSFPFPFPRYSFCFHTCAIWFLNYVLFLVSGSKLLLLLSSPTNRNAQKKRDIIAPRRHSPPTTLAPLGSTQ
jgi:hypothetical protein